MSVVVTTAPVHGVSLTTVKAHLRVEGTDDDALIQVYLDAACAHIDGPVGWLDRAVWPQTMELRQNDFSGLSSLPYGPATSIVSIKYLDADGAEQTVDSGDYALANSGAVELAYNASWPNIRGDVEGVRVRYVAGYAALPPAILSAVLLMIGDLYQNRETVGGDTGQIQMSTTVSALLAPFRAWGV
jgi:uncharacterized phiE125 gp8 family phage protein